MLRGQVNKEKHSGIGHLFYATRWSLAGFRAAFRDETAFRQEVYLSIVLVPLAFWLGKNAIEWVFLVGSLVLVLITELLNTAVEAAVDRIGEEAHALSKKAKDVGSAAVMLSILNAVLVWALIVFWGARP